MASVVEVTTGPGSVRVHVAGLRLHHGLTGCGLMALGLAVNSRRVFMAGAVLVAHDWRDWPWHVVDPC